MWFSSRTRWSAVQGNAHLDELQADLTLALQLGIRGVPLAFIGQNVPGIYAFFGAAEPVVGAVPYDRFAAAIDRALRRRRPSA